MQDCPAETQYVNRIETRTGKVRAVCQSCGKRSAPAPADDQGEPELFGMGPGWSCAPFPHDYVHKDGSVGSMFTCPDCRKKLADGQSIKIRDYTP